MPRAARPGYKFAFIEIKRDTWLAYSILCKAHGSDVSKDLRKLIEWRLSKAKQTALNRTIDSHINEKAVPVKNISPLEERQVDTSRDYDGCVRVDKQHHTPVS